MTKLTQVDPLTVARALLLCVPALLLGACAYRPLPPPESAAAEQALAAAQHAQATADQALAIAQQAQSAATSSRTVSSEMYNRSLRK